MKVVVAVVIAIAIRRTLVLSGMEKPILEWI